MLAGDTAWLCDLVKKGTWLCPRITIVTWGTEAGTRKVLDIIPDRKGLFLKPSGLPHPQIRIIRHRSILSLKSGFSAKPSRKTPWEQWATRSAEKVQPESFKCKSPDQNPFLLSFSDFSNLFCIMKPERSFPRVSWITSSPPQPYLCFKTYNSSLVFLV